MKTLLHICCAPCANQPIEVLRGDGLEVTGYWYNPNIHPFTEYRARRNCVRDYAGVIELPLIERDDYGLRPFVREVAAEMSVAYREALVGTVHPVLFEEVSGDYYTGHAPNYVKVYAHGEDLHNQVRNVRITKLCKDGVIGVIE